MQLKERTKVFLKKTKDERRISCQKEGSHWISANDAQINDLKTDIFWQAFSLDTIGIITFIAVI